MTSISTSDISLDQAHAVVHAALDKAKAIDTKMDIAVVDAGGNLKAFFHRFPPNGPASPSPDSSKGM